MYLNHAYIVKRKPNVNSSIPETFCPEAESNPKYQDDIYVAGLMNAAPKIVSSETLDKVEEHGNWKNMRLVKEFNAEEIRTLKKQPGKVIWIGGSNLSFRL